MKHSFCGRAVSGRLLGLPLAWGLPLIALSLSTGCQTPDLSSGLMPTASNRQTPASARLTDLPAALLTTVSSTMPSALPSASAKFVSSGVASWQGQTLTLQLKLPPLPAPDFATQLLDLSSAAKIAATVTDSYGKTYTPNGAVAGKVNYPVSGVLTLTFNNVVPDALLLVEAQVTDASLNNLPQADLAVALRHTNVSNPTTTLNFQTTAVAKTMKSLLASNAARARAINLTDLETLMATITGITGTDPNFSYTQNHPSLVKTANLASALVSSNPPSLAASASSYRGAGATVNLTISGLLGSDKLQVQIADAASAIRSNLGNGTSSGNVASLKSTPGSGIKVLVTPSGTQSVSYSYSASPSTLSLVDGVPQAVTITATPTLTLTGFSPSSGAAGTTVTIAGTGFTGATAVRFNGVDASSFTVVSDTQLTAVVPPTAVDGVITVVNGSSVNSASPFDVYRRIYVKASAVGSNNGTSWANAYTSLQTALGAAGANDKIWVAAGTYKPHASNSSVSFALPAGVEVYGGFAGNESTLAARNVTTNITLLSGDLQNDDNTTVTPFTTATANSDNLITTGDNTLLDGFTLQGAQASAVSLNAKLNIQLRNLIFRHNKSSGGGSAIGAFASGIQIENVNFYNNYGISDGGTCDFIDSTITLTNSIFQNNKSDRRGALMTRQGSELTITNTTFEGNQSAAEGGALSVDTGAGNSSRSGNLTLSNVIFKSNSAPTGSAIGIVSHKGASSFNQVGMIGQTGSSSVLYINIYNGGSTTTSLSMANMLIANNSSTGTDVIQIYGDTGYTSYALRNITLANNTCSAGASSRCQISNTLSSRGTYQNLLFWKDQMGTPAATVGGNVDLGTGGTPFVNSADPIGADNIWFTADDGFQLSSTATAAHNMGITGANIPTNDITGQARIGNPEPGAYEYP